MSATANTLARRVSPFTVVGVLLLVIGLCCLGWVGYQVFGTNIVSEKAFDTQRTELRAQWDREAETGAQGQKDAKGKTKDVGLTALEGEVTALLRIPAFGADYEIPIREGVSPKTLSAGVGHYAETADPGQIGNFALAGHRITHGQPFSRLLSLKSGDSVIVETRQAIYTYVVDDPPRDLTVKDTATWVIDPVPGETDVEPTEALITLTTCQDLLRSPDRSVGFGHLDTTQNK
jgi:sortase A